MTPRQTESAILDQLVPQLQAEGYDVFVHPRRELLPTFLQDVPPDAIALGEKKNLAIEITSSESRSDAKRLSMEKILHGHPDWELRLIWVSPKTLATAVSPQSVGSISGSLVQVRHLVDDGYTGPALLVAWATFEAVARLLQPTNFGRPQTPGRLVEQLANDGTLLPLEADLLRNLIHKRNALVHGDISMSVDKNEVIRFADVLESIINNELHKDQLTH